MDIKEEYKCSIDKLVSSSYDSNNKNVIFLLNDWIQKIEDYLKT